MTDEPLVTNEVEDFDGTIRQYNRHTDTLVATIPADQREVRAKRIAAAWGYHLFRHDGRYSVVNAGTGEDPMWALAESADLDSVLGWILNGCNEESKELAWEYMAGGGCDDDWKPFTA